MRPHNGFRLILIPGPRIKSTLLRRASFAKASPTLNNKSLSNEHAKADKDGKQVDLIVSTNPFFPSSFLIPLGPSETLKEGIFFSSYGKVVQVV